MHVPLLPETAQVTLRQCLTAWVEFRSKVHAPLLMGSGRLFWDGARSSVIRAEIKRLFPNLQHYRKCFGGWSE